MADLAEKVAKATEINERSRVAVGITSGLALAIFLVGVGRYWGTFETRSQATEQRLSRNETDIKELRETFAKMQQSLTEIQTEQRSVNETIKDTARVTKAIMFEWTDLRVALAERGIIRKGAASDG